MKLTNAIKHSNNNQSKLDNLKNDLENLRIARRMNGAKIRETKARIRLFRQQAKADSIKSTVNKYQEQYYSLAKMQTRNSKAETHVALGIK